MKSSKEHQKEKIKEEQGIIEISTEETRSMTIKKVEKITTTTNSSFPDELLQGKTLQVYWYLLEKGPASIREIHQALNFSSPGLAYYQIKKLIETGRVSKDETGEKYVVNGKVKSGLLSFYVTVGNMMIPRFSVYLVIFLIGFLIYLVSFLILGDDFVMSLGANLFLFALIIGTVAFIYESIKVWDLKPRNKPER
ncbi:MAG: hypothetical protein ACFFFG_14145 [Candidatus Thorarchaeota archaeon]